MANRNVKIAVIALTLTKKLKQTALAGLIGISALFGSGCRTLLLDRNSYFANVKASPDLSGKVYKSN